MITAWILYAIVVGTLLGAGGLAVERLLRAHSLPSRWIWVWAIVLSAGWPLGHWAWDQRPPDPLAPTAQEPVMMVQAETPQAVFLLDPEVVEVSGESFLRTLDGPVLVAWAFSTILLLCFFSVLVLRTHLLRRRWGSGRVGGEPVLYSDEWGPAVVGFIRPQVVLPRWCQEVDDWALRFILDHELEHVRAGDLRLLLAAWVLPVLVPWHLPLWWQLSRLRTAVEGDCDLRVLRRNPGRMKSYVDLLLEVGERSPRRGPLAAMLSEPYETLKRRIKIMTMPFPKNPWMKGLFLAGMGTLLIGLACWAPGPTDAANDEVEAQAENAPPVEVGVTGHSAVPTFTPYTVRPDVKNREEVAAALEREYPASLKDEGISGRVRVWFFVDEEGTVQRVQVNESSGFEALDRAAIQMADIIEFTPALNRDKRVPVWVSLPMAFGQVPPEAGVSSEAGMTGGTRRGASVTPVYSAPEDPDAVGQIGGTARVAATGQPLQYAQILVGGTGYGTISNQEGRFLIDRVPAGSYEVVSIHVGYGQEVRPATVTTGDRVDVEFDLSPQAIPLTEFRVAGGTPTEAADDQERSESPLSVRELKAHPLSGEGLVAVKGMIVITETDEPIGAVDVRIAQLNRGSVTNTDGEFILTGIPGGDHTLLMSHPSFGETTARVVFDPGPMPDPEVELPKADLPKSELTESKPRQLPPPPGGGDAGVVTGFVSEEGTGAPIADARLSLAGLEIGAVSNVEGRFLFFNVPPGTHTLVIEKDGFSRLETEVVVEVGETTEMSPTLRRQQT